MGRPSISGIRVFGPKGERYETALLDTGSHSTILGPDVARDVGIDCRKSEREPNALRIGGVKIPACKRSVKLEITDSECAVTMEVYVAHKPLPGRFSNILGADFMERTGMMLDLRRGDHTLTCDTRRRDPKPPLDKGVRPRKFGSRTK
jgi:hypothetical protein